MITDYNDVVASSHTLGTQKVFAHIELNEATNEMILNFLNIVPEYI